MRFATVTTLLGCLLWAAVGEAQLWRGPAALEINARDQKGGSVAGAEVKLVCRSIDPPDGPAPVKLDAHGHASVGSLAEGKWHLEVSRDGYMTFQADLDVRQNRKPQVLSTLQLNVPKAVHMMDVNVSRGRSVPAPPEAVVAAVPAPPPLRRPDPPLPKTPAPPEPIRPAPETRAPPAAEPTPSPAPPTPQAPSPAPAPVTPTPAPAVAAPPPARPSAAPLPVRRRSYDDRTCVECKPGEASLSVEAVAPAGAGCGPAQALLARAGDEGTPPGCRVLRVTLPAGAKYTGYHYAVQEGAEELDCLTGKDCPGGGRWPVDPVLQRGAGGTTVAAAFESGAAAARERHAVLTVYYTLGKK